MIARFLAWAKAYFEERAFAQAAPALPRYEIRKSDDGFVFWLLDHKLARKYAFRKLEHAERALGLAESGHRPFLIHRPFTRTDYRKAR